MYWLWSEAAADDTNPQLSMMELDPQHRLILHDTTTDNGAGGKAGPDGALGFCGLGAGGIGDGTRDCAASVRAGAFQERGADRAAGGHRDGGVHDRDDAVGAWRFSITPDPNPNEENPPSLRVEDLRRGADVRGV